jgi:hypothetical protein
MRDFQSVAADERLLAGKSSIQNALMQSFWDDKVIEISKVTSKEPITSP